MSGWRPIEFLRRYLTRSLAFLFKSKALPPREIEKPAPPTLQPLPEPLPPNEFTEMAKPSDPIGIVHNPTRLSEYEKNRRRYDKFLEIKRGRAAQRAEREKPVTAKLPSVVEEPALPQLKEPVVVQEDRDGKLVRIAESEFWGEFNFRDTILDQLERYFYYIKRMKKRDKDAYQLFRQIGVTIIPAASCSLEKVEYQFKGTASYDDAELGPAPKLPWEFVHDLPSFGCYAYGADPITESEEIDPELVKNKKMANENLVRWIPRFLYFHKYKLPPAGIQPYSGATIYKVTVWWDKPEDKLPHDPTANRQWRKYLHGGGAPSDYAIAIEPDGTIHALKILECSWKKLYSKRKHANGRRSFTIPQKAWTIPDYFAGKEPPARKLERLFGAIAGWHEGSRLSTYRVAVKRGDLVATFGVNQQRMPYFFADRDLIVDDNGVKSRVFHFVRPHQRANGSLVKAHYRGVRKFKWAGYDVSITVPGLHHPDPGGFNVGLMDEEMVDDLTGTIGSEEMGKEIAAMLEGTEYEKRFRQGYKNVNH